MAILPYVSSTFTKRDNLFSSPVESTGSYCHPDISFGVGVGMGVLLQSFMTIFFCDGQGMSGELLCMHTGHVLLVIWLPGQTKPLQKGVYSLKKEFSPSGANQVDTIEKGVQNETDMLAYPENSCVNEHRLNVEPTQGSEFQITGGIEDNSKIIFLISK